jgi:hypothetical protein
MSVKWETVKVGDVLWDKQRQKMGNTTMSRDAIFSVRVESINYAHGTAIASWNGNPARWYHRSGIERLYRNKPKTKPSIFDRALEAVKGKVDV